MIRGTWVFRDGALIEKHLAEPLPRGPRSGLACPYINVDTIDHEFVPALGRRYTSKRQLRRDAAAKGLREVGTDLEDAMKDSFARMPRKPSAKADLIEGFKKVRDGYRPPPPTEFLSDPL